MLEIEKHRILFVEIEYCLKKTTAQYLFDFVGQTNRSCLELNVSYVENKYDLSRKAEHQRHQTLTTMVRYKV